jgi:hypothetical protein
METIQIDENKNHPEPKTKTALIGISKNLFEQKCDMLLKCRDFVLKNFKIRDFPLEIRGTFINTLFIEVNKSTRMN